MSPGDALTSEQRARGSSTGWKLGSQDSVFALPPPRAALGESFMGSKGAEVSGLPGAALTSSPGV